MTAEPPMYAAAACPVCGATTVGEAGKKCRLSSDETGERWCQGGMLSPEDAGMGRDTDDAPLYTFSPEWAKREAELIDAQIKAYERELAMLETNDAE